MDPRFFRKFADLINEAEAAPEEKQIFVLDNERSPRKIQGTPTRAKEIARHLMMQQELGSWFSLKDGEGNVVLKHGKNPAEKPATSTKPPAVPQHVTPSTEPAQPEEPENDEENPKMSFRDYLEWVRNQGEGGLSQADIDAAVDRLSNPRLADKGDGDVIDGEYEVVKDEPKQISAEGKFEAPKKPKYDYSKTPKPTSGERQFKEPRPQNGILSRSEKIGKDGMVYHWQDPRAY